MTAGIDPTYGINMNQDVSGIVKEYEAQEAKADADSLADDTPKEEMEVNREALEYVAKGRLDPETGREIPLTSKARHIASWRPTARFKNNYLKIIWD